MIEGISSKTAIGPAVRRAEEAAKPEHQRIANDSLAGYFITPRSTCIGESRWPRWLVHFFYDYIFEWGVGTFINVRTRYFDDALINALHEGIEQLVILGAGFDSRSYRLVSPEDGIVVFEVDFPATQNQKRHFLQKVPGHPFEHVRYVPIDFMKDSLHDCLINAGYDPTRKTFILWEGVVYYITEEAVRSTLGFIRNHSAPGSIVVLDFFNIPADKAIRTWHDVEEPILWGITPDEMTAFLTSQGFSDIRLDLAADMGKKYHREKRMRERFVSLTFSFIQATTAEKRE